MHLIPLFRSRPWFGLSTGLIVLTLAGCTVGPDFEKPTSEAPDDWMSWRSGDESLRASAGTATPLPAEWWRAFEDPVLDRLLQRAFEASPDLRTAALRFAQSRAHRSSVAAQRGPEINATGSVTGVRQSEWGAGTRIIDAIVADRQPIIDILSEPFALYQAGFDASWEADLWGRVRRSVEAADADLANQAALFDLARLSLTSDVARNYFELRTTQSQVRLLREDVAAVEDQVKLMEARVQGGIRDHLDLERQRVELAALKSQLPGLLAQEGANLNQIALLLGERPGALRGELVATSAEARTVLPDLGLGLPSEVARRRPDLRAAEARLHRATARIGVARADLYPSIRIGAKFGLESYDSGEFADWSSRAWSIGPTLNLPLYDHGRRTSIVELRELEQQEAAIGFQHTVLRAWHEIDDALTAYVAEQQQGEHLKMRMHSAREAYELAKARYDGGTVDFSAVIDSQRGYLQARRDLAVSDGRLSTRFVSVNKAVGNVPLTTGNPADAPAKSDTVR